MVLEEISMDAQVNQLILKQNIERKLDCLMKKRSLFYKHLTEEPHYTNYRKSLLHEVNTSNEEIMKLKNKWQEVDRWTPGETIEVSIGLF